MDRGDSSVQRVLLTTDTVGGVWTFTLELARELNASGVAVELATMGAPLSAGQRAAVTRLPATAVHESRFRLEWMDDPWRDIADAGEWLLRIAADTAPDVVHLNQFAFGPLSWKAPVLLTGHSCVLSWWEAVHRRRAPSDWNRYRRLVNDGLASADLVIAPSRAMLAALERHYTFAAPRQVIANGRDPHTFRPLPKQPRVIGLGRLWDEAKNVSALAAAAKRVSWPVRVAGPLEDGNGVAAPARSLTSLGMLDEPALAEELARASIAALPVRYEPFGLAALEAGLSGCALVLGNIPSQREIWRGAATFVSPDDPDELARAIEDLIANPARRAMAARTARRRALRYSPVRMARSYLQAYSGLAGSAEEPSATETTACAS